jgi:hypothetical protein
MAFGGTGMGENLRCVHFAKHGQAKLAEISKYLLDRPNLLSCGAAFITGLVITAASLFG